MIERYPPSEMREGFNDNGEEDVFYISNPGLGLWAVRERLLRGEDADVAPDAPGAWESPVEGAESKGVEAKAEKLRERGKEESSLDQQDNL